MNTNVVYGWWNMLDKNESKSKTEIRDDEIPMVKQIHVIVKYRLVVVVPYHQRKKKKKRTNTHICSGTTDEYTHAYGGHIHRYT